MISPFSSKINNPDSSHLPILIANRGRHSAPSSPDSPDSPDLTLQHAAVRQLARVQAVASLISIIAIVSLVYIGYFIDLRLELPRLLALLATAVLTERAFSDAANRHFSPKYNRNQTNLRRLSIVLQTVWIISELAFSSAFAPLLLAVVPSLALSFAGSLTLCILPLAAMVTLTGCLEFLSKIRHRGKRHRRLSSVNSEDFEQFTSANNNSSSTRTVATSNSGKYPAQVIHMPSDIYVSTTTPPLSPADSFLSGSSGGLASGLPSPTGHCPSPDRAAMIRYMQEHGNNNEGMPPSSKDVYLMEHVGSYKDSDESMLFVHKILKPIKTSMNDQHMPAPNADYKPLLQQLMAQSQKQSQGPQNNGTTTANGMAVMQPCPPLFQPAVVATITVVKGKGNNTLVNTNQPQIPIPVIS